MVAEQQEQAAAHGVGKNTEDEDRQAGQRLLKTRDSLAGATAFRQQDDAEGASGLEAFGLGAAGTPGHGEQHEEQRLEVPAAPASAAVPRLVGLLEHLRREELPQASKERLRLLDAAAAFPFLGHKPFLCSGLP